MVKHECDIRGMRTLSSATMSLVQRIIKTTLSFSFEDGLYLLRYFAGFFFPEEKDASPVSAFELISRTPKTVKCFGLALKHFYRNFP